MLKLKPFLIERVVGRFQSNLLIYETNEELSPFIVPLVLPGAVLILLSRFAAGVEVNFREFDVVEVGGTGSDAHFYQGVVLTPVYLRQSTSTFSRVLR